MALSVIGLLFHLRLGQSATRSMLVRVSAQHRHRFIVLCLPIYNVCAASPFEHRLKGLVLAG